MSQRRGVVDGIYGWIPEGPARPNVMRTAHGVRNAAVVGEMRPVIGLPAIRSDAAIAHDAERAEVRKAGGS